MTTSKQNRTKSREAALQALFCNAFSDRELLMSVAAVQEVRTVEDFQAAIAAARQLAQAAEGVVRTMQAAIEALALCNKEGGRAQIKVTEESLTGNLLHLADTRKESILTLRRSADALESVHLLFDTKGFAIRLLSTFARHEEAIDSAIQRALTGWNLRRLTSEDRSLIRLGTTELMFMTDVPPAVIIDQYVELAKEYGDKDSPKLVNGVLDRVLKDNPRPAAPAEKPVAPAPGTRNKPE